MSTAYAIFATISAILWALTTLAASIALTLFCKNKQDAPGIKLAVRLSTAFFIVVILSGIGMCYKRICGALRDFNPNTCQENNCYPMEAPMAIMGGAFIVISFVLILYIFVSRLKNAFDNTPYAYPRCFYICICCEIAMVAICAFVGGILHNIGIISGIAIFLAILNCILLTILFIHSLKKVITSEDNRKSMTDTMVKFVVLVSLTMASTLIGSIALILYAVFGGIALSGLEIIIGPIDMITNALCIYLQFDDTHYKLCGKYHGFVEYLFDAENNLENDIEVQIATNDTIKPTSNEQETIVPQTPVTPI